MAKDTEPPNPKPSLADTQARDNFIAVALREIIADQVAKGKWNHDMAATHAVRYANAAMAVRGIETAPLKVVMSKGVAAPVDMAPGSVLPSEVETETKPKSISEIIGDAPELAEVK